MSDWYANGQAIASLALDDRAAQYGDGVFETIAIRDGMPRLLDAHIARLQSACARLGLACPAPATLRAELAVALAATSVATGFATAKLVIVAGGVARGYRRPADAETLLRVGIFPAAPLTPQHYHDGVDTLLCNTRLAEQPQLAGIKSLNRLEQILARSEWSDREFEGLLCDAGGRLICGTMSNVFLAKQSTLVTPAITRCGVAGIMRGHVLGLLHAAGIDCEVRDVARAELFAAEEVFLTNSQVGVVPVRRCATQQYTIGALTRRTQALAVANGVAECRP